MTRIFTIYTENTPYEEEAKELVWAFSTFGIEVKAIAIKSAGDWMLNALSRAPILQIHAEAFRNDTIVVLDADIRPKARPAALFDLDADIGAEYRGDKAPEYRRYSAGVLAFSPSAAARSCLYDWAKMCVEDPYPSQRLREQQYLFETIERHVSHGLRFRNLGNRYNRKPEQVKAGDDTVLIHDVASRRYLGKEIKGKR